MQSLLGMQCKQDPFQLVAGLSSSWAERRQQATHPWHSGRKSQPTVITLCGQKSLSLYNTWMGYLCICCQEGKSDGWKLVNWSAFPLACSWGVWLTEACWWSGRSLCVVGQPSETVVCWYGISTGCKFPDVSSWVDFSVQCWYWYTLPSML